MSNPPVISINDELISELEQLADKATPGKYCTDGNSWVMAADSDQLNHGFVIAICDGPDADNNADYLAKLGPPVVRALLSERAQLIESVRELKSDAERYRWLRDKANWTKENAPQVVITDWAGRPISISPSTYPHGEVLDKAIDLAMSSGGEG